MSIKFGLQQFYNQGLNNKTKVVRYSVIENEITLPLIIHNINTYKEITIRLILFLLLSTFLLTAVANIYGNNEKYNIGYQYYHGEGVEKNKKKACDLFEESSKEGYALAMSAIADCYWLGEGNRKLNLKKSIYWYKKSVKHGYKRALGNLSLIYLFEYLDYEKAYYYAKKREKEILNMSAFFIKFHYYLRRKKVHKAIEALKISSEKGYIFAIVQLAHFYKNGICQVPKDYEEYLVTKALYKLAIKNSLHHIDTPFSKDKTPDFEETTEFLKKKKLFIQSCQ